MHLALLVEVTAARRGRERALVPDVGMEIDAEAAVRPEGDELLRRGIFTGRAGRHDERLAVDRPEELSAVGMVVDVPEMDVPRRGAIAQHVVAAHRSVDAAQLVALPFAG